MKLDNAVTVIGDIQLPDCVKTVLEKGPSCAIWSRTSSLVDIPIIEELVKSKDDLKKDRIQWNYVKERQSRTAKVKRSNEMEIQLIRKTNKWIEDNNIVVTREDKSKKLVLMHRKEYYEFLEKYIRDTKPKILPGDPTLKMAARVNSMVSDKNFPTIWKQKNQRTSMSETFWLRKNP